LGTFATAIQQHHNLHASLREIQSPTCAVVNPKLGNAFTYRLDIAHQAAFQSLDSKSIS